MKKFTDVRLDETEFLHMRSAKVSPSSADTRLARYPRLVRKVKELESLEGPNNKIRVIQPQAIVRAIWYGRRPPE